jgi:hypothetical protein
MIRGLMIAVSLLTIVVTATTGCVEPGTASVAVEVVNADSVGAIAFEVVYDATLLEVIRVNPDDLADGANSGFNNDTPGRLLIVVQQAPSINGTGDLVTIQFDILRGSGQTSLALENMQARSLATGQPVPVQGTAGSVKADDASYVSPRLIFGS